MRSNQQTGSALVFGLIFLLILTILATTGMRMARMQIVMSGNEQFYAQALNAAEAAVEAQIADGKFNTGFISPSNPVDARTPSNIAGRATIQYLNEGMAPDGGYSDDVLTYRFRVDATGRAPVSDARASVAMRQGIYILAPGGS